MRRLCIAVVLLFAACREAPPLPARGAPLAPAVTALEPAAAAAQPEKAPPARAPADRLTLLFSASVAGQLVPCGCSPDQRGGLPRAVSYARKLRSETPNLLVLDAGDLLFDGAQSPPAQLLTQKKLKAQALAAGDELIGVAARALGPRDLTLGAQFAGETAGKIPLLDSGLAPLPAARATLLLDAGAVKVGVLAASSAESLTARAAALRQQGAQLVVALLQPTGDNAFAAAQQLLAKSQGVDLAVLGHRDDPATDVDRKDTGTPPLLAVEGHGQSLLRVDIQLGQGPLRILPGPEERKGELDALQARIDRFKSQLADAPARAAQLQPKIAELEQRKAALAAAPPETAPAGAMVATPVFVPLTKEVGEDAPAQKLVDAYDARVTELNLAEAKTQPEACPPASPGEASFVGAARCAECHAEAAQFWTQTGHSNAYETLVKVNKQFSLDCVRCHVTGWQQPGGVCRIDKAASGGPGFQGRGVGRRDVQCEDCHGPGSEHSRLGTGGGIRDKVPASWCMRCHEAANSPHFDDAKYRPWITGPGHGMPLAKGEKPHPKGLTP